MRSYTQAESDLDALRRRWVGVSPDDIDLTDAQRQIVTDLNVLLDALDDTERAGLNGELDDLTAWLTDDDGTLTRRDIERACSSAEDDLEEKSGAAVLAALAPHLAKLRDPGFTGVTTSTDPRTRWIGLPTIRMHCGTEIAYPVARLMLLLWEYRPADWTGTSPYGGPMSAGENADGEYLVSAGPFILDGDNAAELARKVRGA